MHRQSHRPVRSLLLLLLPTVVAVLAMGAPLPAAAGAGPGAALPHAGPSGIVGVPAGGPLRAHDTLDACGGANFPPTAWENVAANEWPGGGYWFMLALGNTAAWAAHYDPQLEYMAWMAANPADQDYLGAIVCRESDYQLQATDGIYTGIFQLSPADWQPLFGPDCTQYAFMYTGCGYYNAWQTQMLAGLYYAQVAWGGGGNLSAAWQSELTNGWW